MAKKKVQRSGGLIERILKIIILLGLISAVILAWMGSQKAEEAEKAAVPVKDLYSVYVTDSTTIPQDIKLINGFLEEIPDPNGSLAKIGMVLRGTGLAGAIADEMYLPKDGTVSNAFGRLILRWKVNETYNKKEQFLIYCGIKGTPPADGDFLKKLTKGNLSPLREISVIDADFFLGIVDVLEKNDILSEENAEKARQWIKQ